MKIRAIENLTLGQHLSTFKTIGAWTEVLFLFIYSSRENIPLIVGGGGYPAVGQHHVQREQRF
jgi:hypothetical protein